MRGVMVFEEADSTFCLLPTDIFCYLCCAKQQYRKFLLHFLKKSPQNLPDNPLFQSIIEGHFITWQYIPSATWKS